MKYCILFLGILATTLAQNRDYTTPVPILKQINRHNEDGSYSYGYEAADGTYKIESKYPNGEVFGKYGFVDDAGKLREIEYGASRRGFEPLGNEINVAPPTINNDYPKPLAPNEEDDGQYREDPAVYYKNEGYNQNPAPKYQSNANTRTTFSNDDFGAFEYSFGPKINQPSYRQPAYTQPAYQQPSYQPSHQQSYQPSYQPAPQQPSYQQPAFRPSTKFSFDDFIQNRPQPQPNFQPSYYNPPPPAYTHNYGGQFAGHPATNVDLNLGSYTVNYKRR